jgi:hypothetical protein
MRLGVSGGEVTSGGGREGGVELGKIEGFLLATHRWCSGEVRLAFDSDFAAAARWAARENGRGVCRIARHITVCFSL